MAAGRQDAYVNVLKASVTMSAANTLTFSEIEVGLNLFDKVGLLIHRVSYDLISTDWRQLVADTDDVSIALTASNSVSSIAPAERSTIDYVRLTASVDGTPAALLVLESPIVHDFSDFPGGGLLIPPKPLYLAMASSGYSAAGDSVAMIYFTIKSLKDADYFELLETYRFFE